MKQLLINPLQKISRTSFAGPSGRGLSTAGGMCLAAAAANVGHLAHSTALRAGQLVGIIPYFWKKSKEIEINVRDSILYS